MDDLREQLIVCFAAVFPAVPPEELETLEQANCSAWTSVTHVTLIVAVEQALGVRLDYTRLVGIGTFESFLDTVRVQLVNE